MSVDTGYLAALVDGCPPPEYTLRLAAKAFGVTIHQLTMPAKYCKDRKVQRYRSVSMAAMRAVSRPTYRAIGALFGGRDHTAVLNSVQRCQKDAILRDAVDSLCYQVRRQWAVDNGLPVPPDPNQLRLEGTDGA